MEAGLAPTAAATWGRLPSVGGPSAPGLDFPSSHWGPIIYPQQQEASQQGGGGDHQKPPGYQQQQQQHASPRGAGDSANSSSEALGGFGSSRDASMVHIASSEALRTSSSASSSAPMLDVPSHRPGTAGEFSGRGGEAQQEQLALQQQYGRRSSFESGLGRMQRVSSNEGMHSEHQPGVYAGGRPRHGSSEALDQAGVQQQHSGRPSSSGGGAGDAEHAHPPGLQQHQHGSGGGGMHRRRGSGAEEDIFSAVGGIEMDAEHRSGSVGHGLDGLHPVGSRSSLGTADSLPPPPPPPERETRTLVVRGVNTATDDSDFKQLFEQYGDLRTLYTACKEQGWLMISYYNIIAAKLAKINLHGQRAGGGLLEVAYAPCKEGREFAEGTVTLTNHNPDLSDAEIVRMVAAEYGEVHAIHTPADNPSKRHIDFCDVRHAQAARQALEGIAAKIPTISEQAASASELPGPGPLRAVQSSFFPGVGPAAPAHPPLPQPAEAQMRAHSWDVNNGSGQLAGMAGFMGNASGQGQLLQQLNPQLLANLSTQNLYGQAGGMGSGSSGNLAALQADVDTLMRSGYLSGGPGSSNALQALLSNCGGSCNSLASTQGGLGSHPNLAALQGAAGPQRGPAPPGGPPPLSPHRGPGSGGPYGSPRTLMSAGSQHMSASQLLALEAAAAEQAAAAGGFNPGRRQASMSTGNLVDLYQQQAQQRIDGRLGSGGMPGGGGGDMRGVASSSNIWDAQLPLQSVASSPASLSNWVGGDGGGWQGAPPNQAQAALQAQAQALALQLGLAGGLDGQGGPGGGFLGPASPRGAAAQLGALAQQQLLQQQLQNLTLQQSTAALLAQVQQNAGLLRGLTGAGAMGAGGPRGGGGRGGGREELSGGRLSRRVSDPAAEAERRAAQEKMYSLDMDKVMRGEDKRTTLMVKNIPNKYTQKMLLATIDEAFRGHYDFFYLPIDFKNKCNVGYAFINMILPEYIPGLYQRFHARKWEKFNSEKVCHISYARIQGKANLVTHFQNSSLLHEDKRCRPILFRSDDAIAGEQEPFPAGPNVRSRPARPGSTGSGLNSLGSAASLGSLGVPGTPSLGLGTLPSAADGGRGGGLLKPSGAPW